MEILVDSLKFSFPPGYEVIKYDECSSYKKFSSAFQLKCECEQCPSHDCQGEACVDFSKCELRQKTVGLKGVDLVAKTSNSLYLIESKDYRKNDNPPVDHIIMEVVKKFRDTLFGIWCGSFCEIDHKKMSFFDKSRRTKLDLKFYFHFESPLLPYKSGLFRSSTKAVPTGTVLERLKQKMGPMKDFVFVTDMDKINSTPAPCEWQVKEKI